jgi:hypothetical protein
MHKRTILTLTLATLFVAVNASPVFAAAAQQSNPTSSGQALEIAPPVMSLTVNPGQTTSVQIYLRDISKSNLVVTSQVNDFVAAGEDGTPKILLNNDENNPYSIKGWVGSLPSLTLIPRQIKPMTVTINVPKNASPGGHYGVIRFTATPPELQGTGVSLSASLGALVLLTVNGKISENLAVQEFSVNQAGHTGSLFESGPLNFVERFKNAGNVHAEPVGQVTVTDTFGKKLAAVNVNLPPRNILPDSIRKFEEPLDKTVIGNKMLFGRYTAKLSVTYGTDEKALNDSLVFWIIPYRLIAAIAAILIAGFFGLRFLIKHYNRYVVAQANKSRR